MTHAEYTCLTLPKVILPKNQPTASSDLPGLDPNTLQLFYHPVSLPLSAPGYYFPWRITIFFFINSSITLPSNLIALYASISIPLYYFSTLFGHFVDFVLPIAVPYFACPVTLP